MEPYMTIRKAEEKDIDQINHLLYQVQKVHSDVRPDIFTPGEKKYQEEELRAILRDEKRPIFVAVDENDSVSGYAFCIYEEVSGVANLQDMKTLYIDDLCVDEKLRHTHIGTHLYEHVVKVAKASGCYRVTLNVWHMNEAAMRFYEKCGLAPLKTTMELIV